MSSFDNPTLGDNILTEDSRVAQFESYLVYILPPLATIVLPFSLFNIYVLNVTNRMGSSSHFLYLNILSTGTRLLWPDYFNKYFANCPKILIQYSRFYSIIAKMILIGLVQSKWKSSLIVMKRKSQKMFNISQENVAITENR